MSKYYDATTEHKMFERSAQPSKTHPNKGLKGKNPYSGKTVSD